MRQQRQSGDEESRFRSRNDSKRKSEAVSGAVAQADDDKYHKPGQAAERQWLGMPIDVLKERVSVLTGLMVVQSLSGMILGRFEELIQKHVVVTLFLTMLVGAGGNAGNQSTVSVIRGLATGQVSRENALKVVLVESKMGVALGLVLAFVACARVLFTGGDLVSGMAIGSSVFCIVATSTLVGSALPILLHRNGIDAAHAGPAIQVVMDIAGVTITCLICASLFSLFQRE